MIHRRAPLLLIAALITAQSLSAQSLTVNIDAAANRHPIDPNVYGVAWVGSTADLNLLGATLNRWGGNATSRHNWIFSTTNRAKDYFFINIPDGLQQGSPVAGGSADDFIALTRAGINGVEPVITIPMMSLLPKDRSKRCSYRVSLYGAQEETAPLPFEDPDCGNGKRIADGTRMKHVNDTGDTAATYPLTHQTDWIQHLIDTWQPTPGGTVRYYSLDNEPSLWSFDHWDIHPDGSTYDEVWGKMRDFGAAIKAKDPDAITTGPEEWGWSGYFESGLDQESGNADRMAHGDTAYIDWLVQQAKDYEIANGLRVLDVLTVHFYPQNGEFYPPDVVTPTMQAFRNRSTRALWDPAYVDESWIGGTGIDGGIVRLIPRLKAWVSIYPGTKIGITEYNWGAEGHINGATAQADVLGILGREGVDMAIRWTAPVAGTHTFNAFRMYRNYDGAQSRFGDVSISAGGPNPDNVAVFAAIRSSDSALTIMLISKTAGDKATTVNLQNFVPFRGTMAQRRQLDAGNVITSPANVPLEGSSISLTLPGQSITLLVVAGATAPGAPVIGAATPGDGSATIAFTPPANDGGSDITSYTATCNPGAVTGSSAASPVTVSGLTNGVMYNCSVLATNVIGTSAPSGTVSVTPAVPLGAPSALAATATSSSQISLTWTAGAGAMSYEIYRSFGGNAFTFLDQTTLTTYGDSLLSPITTYLYKVRAIAAGGSSPFCAVNAATTIIFTDDPLASGAQVKALHITQLRDAVTAIRTAAGLPERPFSDPVLSAGALIRAAHVTDLRSALEPARAAIGLPALTYTQPTIVPGVTTAKALDVFELRNGVK